MTQNDRAGVKYCRKCRQTKPLDEFYIHKDGSPYSKCQTCTDRVRALAGGTADIGPRADDIDAPERERRVAQYARDAERGRPIGYLPAGGL